MGVIKHNKMYQVRQALQTRANNWFKANPIRMTAAEYMAAFINPEHIAPLEQVREIVGDVSSTYHSASLYAMLGDKPTKVSLSISFNRRAPTILPRYTAEQFSPTCPPELRRRFEVDVQRRIRDGYSFGTAWDCLEWLNGECKSTHALAFLFPALPILLRDTDTNEESATTKLAFKLDGLSKAPALPAIPREVKQRALELSELVSATSLLPKDISVSAGDDGDALFTLNETYKLKFSSEFAEMTNATVF
jgi:hypothetical protein